jgi:hypothetical protein
MLLSTATIFTASDIRHINATCHAPRGWLVMHGYNSVRLKPPHDADYHKVDCVLARLKDLSIKRGASPAMGFIGNESFK